jgi:hypothetical protein
MTQSYLVRFGALAGVLLAGAQSAQAVVTSYFVGQGMIYQQSSAAAPVPVAFTPAEFVARVIGDAASVDNATVTTPSIVFPSVPLDLVGNYAQFAAQADLASVQLFGPNGTYSFVLDNGTTAPLNFSAGSFPTAVPQVLNFDAAQNVDPSAPFTVNFTPFTGAGANDFFEFEILNSDNSFLFQKAGTGTSVTIPAGTLTAGDSYQANLVFVHGVSANTTSIPGATGTAGYYNETQFSVSTTGSGGGGGTTGGGTGDDTTPPALLFTTPTPGSTGVPASSPVVFLFSEAMAKQQSIQWGGTGVNAANFTYSWTPDGQALTATYTGGFPANTTVTYALQGGDTGFKDLAGNALPAGAQGSFTTGTSGGGTTGGGTGNDPCRNTNSVPSGTGGGSLFKMLQFTQTGNADPVPDPDAPASAIASYSPATNQTVTAVKVTPPTGTPITLSNLFNTYFAIQSFPSAAAMDAVLQPGNYTITVTPVGSGTVVVPAISTIPTPKILNLAALASFDPTKDFVLNFSPFTGASGFDAIAIDITAPGGHHFYAPDYCLPRPLPNTATSVTIPANTFSAGDKLSGGIQFSKFSVNSNSIPNTFLSAGAFAITSFDLAGGTTGSGVSFNPPAINPDGTIVITAPVPAGKTLQVQTSTDLKTWIDVGTPIVPVGGIATYTINPKTIGGNRAFYRAKVQ